MTIGGETVNHVIYANEGSHMELVCKVRSGYPKEMLSWISDKKILIRSYSGTVKYSKIPTKSDHLKTFTCKAVVTRTQFVIEKTITLHLNFFPDVYVEHNPIIKVVEGNNLDLICKITSNSTIKQIEWRNQERRLSVKNNVLQFSQIKREEAGKYSCEVENIAGKGIGSIEVVVQYAPDISFNDNISDTEINIKCVPSGIPNVYTFFEWEHLTEYRNTIKYLKSDKYGSITFKRNLDSKWYLRRGLYICSVSNGIPKNNEKIMKGTYFLDESGKPHFVNTNNETQYGNVGENTTIVVDFISFPKINNITVNTESSIVTELDILDDVKVTETVLNTMVFMKGSRVLIHQVIKSENKVQQYTVALSNKFGSESFTIELRQASPVQQFETGNKIYIAIPIVLLFLLIGFTILTIIIRKGWHFDIQLQSCFRKRYVPGDVGVNVIENEIYGGPNNNHEGNSNSQHNNDPVYSSIERRERVGQAQVVVYGASQRAQPKLLNHHLSILGDEQHCVPAQDIAVGRRISATLDDSQLNYIEVCFDQPPSEYRKRLLSIDQKNPYAEIDFSRTADVPRVRPKVEENDDNDFVDIDDIKKLRKKSYSH